MIKKSFMVLVAIITLGVSMFLACNVRAAPEESRRIWGNNRYETCSAIVQDGWTSSCDYAIIVNGENFPDALSAGPLAKKYNAPILLTESSTLDQNAYNQLKRLNVKQVFIIGGTAVVDLNVEKAINNLGIHTTRYAGQNRNETSIEVAKQIGADNGVVLVPDDDFADALSASPIAAKLQMPIILMPKDTMPQCVKEFISGKNIPTTYIMEEHNAISNSVISQFPETTEFYGTSIYERNLNIVNSFHDKLNLDNIYLAYSEKFPDALSGAAVAALQGNPIFLVGDSVSKNINSYIQDNLDSIKRINILGGPAGIKDSVASEITGIEIDTNASTDTNTTDASNTGTNLSSGLSLEKGNSIELTNNGTETLPVYLSPKSTAEQGFDYVIYKSDGSIYSGYCGDTSGSINVPVGCKLVLTLNADYTVTGDGNSFSLTRDTTPAYKRLDEEKGSSIELTNNGTETLPVYLNYKSTAEQGFDYVIYKSDGSIYSGYCGDTSGSINVPVGCKLVLTLNANYQVICNEKFFDLNNAASSAYKRLDEQKGSTIELTNNGTETLPVYLNYKSTAEQGFNYVIYKSDGSIYSQYNDDTSGLINVQVGCKLVLTLNADYEVVCNDKCFDLTKQ